MLSDQSMPRYPHWMPEIQQRGCFDALWRDSFHFRVESLRASLGHRADHAILENRFEELKEEKAAEQVTVLSLRGELEGCRRRLELATSSEISKENAMLRTALMNEWKQFRKLEMEYLSPFRRLEMARDGHLQSSASNASLPELDASFLEEFPAAATTLEPRLSLLEEGDASLPALRTLSLLEEGVGELAKPLLRVEAQEPALESSASQELKTLEAKLTYKAQMLERKERELDNCKFDRKILRWALLCTVLVCMAIAYCLVRSSSAAHLTCSQ